MKRLTRNLLLAVALVGFAVDIARADVSLPNIFSHHMVLQRDVAIPVFGFADPGEAITVEFAGQKVMTEADANGKWKVELPKMKASGEGRTMKVSGKNTITYEDVLVGDVWICSGQSNMEWPMTATNNSDEEIANAKHEGMRLFNVPGHITAATPQDSIGGEWKVCSPESVAGFSAVGYFFGRDLHSKTGIPIGLLGTNWGGTRIEPWTPPIGFRQVPELKEISERVDLFDPATPQGQATWKRYLEDVEAYAEKAHAAMAHERALPNPVEAPGFMQASQPTTIYNAMVAPLVPYAVRGAIWYQGESNGSEGVEYYHKMRALIEGWRSVWSQDLPMNFYFVQLANFQQPNDNPQGGDGWARLREAQRKALEIPHTGMAVIIDIGEANDIHPRNKQDVGARLARWALRDVFQQDIEVSGPLYREMKTEGNRIRIHFDHAKSGLMVGKKVGMQPTQEVADGKVERIAIAGADKTWHWAEAKIEGDTLIVWSDEVDEPVAVRYAYSQNPVGANLYNKEGLPASPFRTDDW